MLMTFVPFLTRPENGSLTACLTSDLATTVDAQIAAAVGARKPRLRVSSTVDH